MSEPGATRKKIIKKSNSGRVIKETELFGNSSTDEGPRVKRVKKMSNATSENDKNEPSSSDSILEISNSSNEIKLEPMETLTRTQTNLDEKLECLLSKLTKAEDTYDKRLKKIEEQNKSMLEILNSVKSAVLQLQKDVETLSYKRKEGLNDSFLQPPSGYPLKTVNEFRKMEEDTAEGKEERERIFNYLKAQGASRFREFLNMSMRRILTDRLLSKKFTWLGTNGTESLGNSKISSVIYLAAQQCRQFRGPENKNEFKNEMLEVLRITKQRYKKHTEAMANAGKQTSAEKNLLSQLKKFGYVIEGGNNDDEDADEDAEVDGQSTDIEFADDDVNIIKIEENIQT